MKEGFELLGMVVSLIAGILGIVLSIFSVRDKLRSAPVAQGASSSGAGLREYATTTAGSAPLYRATIYCLLAILAYASLNWFSGYNTAISILDGIRFKGCEAVIDGLGGILSREFVPTWIKQETYYALIALLASALALVTLVIGDLRRLFKRRR